MTDERPTFGSLFAGIGGIDLGLERAGWECRWQVEWDAYCQRVLAKHWPDVPRYGDITTVDWSGVERVDLLAGGFPCQPVSGAGKRKAQGDERWLWPEFLRAVRALRPSYVLVENVTNLLAISGGSAFGEVVGGLAASGYDTEWDCVPAAAVRALHERDRVWIVAYADRDGRDANGSRQERPEGAALGPALALGEHGCADELGPLRRAGASVADPASLGGGALRSAIDGARWTGRAIRGGPTVPDANRLDAQRIVAGSNDSSDGRVPSQRPLGLFRGAGRDRAWPPEPDVGRVAHGVPARVDRLRALGNAVVPQVVEVIGRQLLAAMNP